MISFDDYISEKQNFIFGGKNGLTGKEYGHDKYLNELTKGDILYSYQVEIDGNDIRVTNRSGNTVVKTNLNGANNKMEITLAGIIRGTFNVYISKYYADKPCVVFGDPKTDVEIYSTYKLTNKEIESEMKNL